MPTPPLPHLPPRDAEGHKGAYGRVLVIAGSRDMAGAAVLAGRAALRGGAGLVTVATTAGSQPVVAGRAVCCLTRGLPETPAGTLRLGALPELMRLAEASDVVALGPGLGVHPSTAALVGALVERATRPLVLDADGLNNLAGDLTPIDRAAGPRVLTPHPGEMARLADLPGPGAVQKARSETALAFAAEHGCVLVLKGHGTVVTDGDELFVNETGNPGMATAGSGDVLTGLLAALLGQGLAPLDAARLATHVHGLAGDLARARLGELALTALDLLDYLPAALTRIAS